MINDMDLTQKDIQHIDSLVSQVANAVKEHVIKIVKNGGIDDYTLDSYTNLGFREMNIPIKYLTDDLTEKEKLFADLTIVTIIGNKRALKIKLKQ